MDNVRVYLHQLATPVSEVTPPADLSSMLESESMRNSATFMFVQLDSI